MKRSKQYPCLKHDKETDTVRGKTKSARESRSSPFISSCFVLAWMFLLPRIHNLAAIIAMS